MSSQLDTYDLELFQIEKQQLLDISDSLPLKKYAAYIPHSAMSIFKDEASCFWHLTELLRAKEIVSTVIESGPRKYLVILGEHNLSFLSPYFMKDQECQISLNYEGDLKLDLSLESDFTTFRRIITTQLKINAKPPLYFSGLDVVDKSEKIIEPTEGSTQVLRFMKHCFVYRGAALRFRKYGDSFFLQIIPQSKIELDTELDKFIADGTLDKGTLPQFISHVRLPNGKNVPLLTALDRNACDKITESKVFEGRSFLEFAQENYPFLQLKNPYSLMVGVGTETGPATFSLESLRASLTFSSLNSLDEEFFSKLIKILKLESAKRLDRAVTWINKITPLEIGQAKLRINTNPYEVHVLKKEFETDLSDLDPFVSGGTFKRPPISLKMLDEKGEYKEREIPPGYLNKYKGTVNDIFLNPELKPLEVPARPRILVLVQKDLKKGWLALLKSLKEGVGQRGYRGFQQTFEVDPIFRTRYIEDFFSKEFDQIIAKLKEKQYDCAIVVIPRFLKTPGETKRIYTETKTKIMQIGIPVQVVTDDPRITESRNNTLMGKSMNAYTCFGISLNILVKMGAMVTALAPSFSDNLLASSVIIGYDVIRVPKNEELSKSLYSLKRTIPLAAPLVIFDNRGSKISHHWIYRLESETSLFEGENGREILSQIAADIDNVVIHKDGPFYPSELDAIEKLFDGKKKVFPISIIRNEVPRIFNPRFAGAGFELKNGTFLELGENEYVISTTPIASWTPERLGWPCPILVRFHGKHVGSDPLTKRKLLFQIYALTKMQVGSQRATRVPISVHYSNMIARFIRKVGDPTPAYLRFFVRRLPDQRFIPKWYA